MSTDVHPHAGVRRHRHVKWLPFLSVGWLALLVAPGCVPSIEPQYPQSIATALARRPMRTVESEHVVLEYPQARRDLAFRFLPRLEACAAYLKRASQLHNNVADRKMLVVMPDLPFNNAFVGGGFLGYDIRAVVPTHTTSAQFALEMGVPPDPATIGCHEIVHHVQLLQVAGFALFMNQFGATYTPQVGLDGWFLEGLAVYYETKLSPGTGRLAWPFWRGTFAAAYAGRRINGGSLSVWQRNFHGGNQYLVGSHFVHFLADRYGEDKLWKLVRVQAWSFMFPLWVNVRFWQAYDKSLSTLIDEFAAATQAELKVRARPNSQRTLRPAGDVARYARANDGTEAVISAARDLPPRLTLTRSGGRPDITINLVDVLPPRQLIDPSVSFTSGLSFTADGRSLYFVAVATDVVRSVSRLVRVDVQTGQLAIVHPDLGGGGGSVSPDGERYAFARADGDHHDLAQVDLRTGAVRVLAVENQGAFAAEPRYSPDGSRLVAPWFDGEAFRIATFDANSGRRLRVLATVPGPVHDPAWVDDRRIVYLGTQTGDGGFQVFLHDTESGANTRVTEAPYLASQPRPIGDSLRFLNREGWSWTVDEVVLPHAPPSTTPAPSDEVLSVPPPQPSIANAEPPAPPSGPPPPPSPPPPPPPMPVPSPPVNPSTSLSNLASISSSNQVTSDFMRTTDRPYSPWERLFVPRLYGPGVFVIGRHDVSLGLVLSGNDRLELHRWSVAGYYQFEGGGSPSFEAGYLNQQLAPLALRISFRQFQVYDTPPVPDGVPEPAASDRVFSLFRRDRYASFGASRAFYDNPVEVGFSFIETYRPDDPSVLVPLRRFAGPRLAASFSGFEVTADSGIRRGVWSSLDLANYPAGLNTLDAGFTDLSGRVWLALPLPLSRRHVLTLFWRGRILAGLTSALPLLAIGGYGNWARLGRDGDTPERKVYESALLPPGVPFFERLRGFEDYALYANRVAIADAAYRYPMILDWGSASTLGILPALFFRQIDFELFAAAAVSGATVAQRIFAANDPPAPSRHLAAGVAISLKMALWIAPFSIRYQFARRATDDHGAVHLVTLSI